METITQALARHALERPGHPALADGRVRLAWSEVKSWVDRAAGWFLELDLPRGSTVLGWLPNCAEWYLLRLACEEAGLFWVPVPASHGSRELRSIIERARPAVLITLGEFRERNYAAEASRICAAASLTPFRLQVPPDTLLRLDGPPAYGPHPLRMDEPAHALSTTGSEGIPKLAIYTLAAACERAHAQARLLGLTARDVILVLSPGTGPARAAWLAAPIAGSCVLGLPVFSVAPALALIAQEHATIVCGTPAQLAMLAAKLEGTDTSSVRIWYTAGSVLPPPLAEELERSTRGIVLSTYGGADFGGWAAPDPTDPPEVRHHTVGRARGGTEFRIVDDEDKEVPGGQIGELMGRGPCCVSGYLGEQGRQAWRDGWFHTGDLASQDASGNIVVVGRLKEIIVRGGDKISPVEIETVLRTRPEVTQVAVVGVPDDILGERVCACVVPAGEAQPPDLETLRQYLTVHGIARYKIPERMLILSALPLVGDKVDRKALARLAASAT